MIKLKTWSAVAGVLLLPVFCSCAENYSFKDVTASGGKSSDYFQGFESVDFKINPKFKVIRGEGVNGNYGLVYKADKTRSGSMSSGFR